uniref:Uncharacterized protein n=1 Tax=Cucumis melo TaxID=3656 RepID=A0A9I9E2H6_CUCME
RKTKGKADPISSDLPRTNIIREGKAHSHSCPEGRQKAKPIRSPRIYQENETTTDRESPLSAYRPFL